MSWIFLMLFLGLLGAIGVGLGTFVLKRPLVGRIAVGAAGFLAFAFTLGYSIEQVGAGEVGVVFQFGSIVDQRGEGLAFIAPWQSMETESIKVQKARFENMENFSEETQAVYYTATLNFSVAESAIQDLYRGVGVNWYDVLIEARVFDALKTETVKYKTDDVAPNRERIRTAAKTKLSKALESYGITVTDLLLDNITFSQEYMAAIEAKQVATQDALREQERVAQVQAQARQEEERAKGEANATRERAKGQADANREIAASLTPEVLQSLAIEKFADDIKGYLVPSGAGMLLDPSTLLGQSPQANQGGNG